MHPEFHQASIRRREQELAESARRASLARRPDPLPAPAESLILRLRSVGDDDALARLAALEGVPMPAAGYVVAEVDGVVVAALALGQGPPLADPFRHTAHLLQLLELRVRQLTEGPRTRSRLTLWSAVRNWSRA